MIPKIIHICWFSNDSFPVEVKLCMQSWKKILPDFSWKIWKMEDALSLKCEYVNEALQCRKWAFAADVVRIYALYTEGGIYMDSDILLKKRFDQFLNKGTFITFNECPPYAFKNIEEIKKTGEEQPFGLQAAFMIGKKDNDFCKSVLEYYYNRHFLNNEVKMDLTIAPYIYASIAADSYGFEFINKNQELRNGVVIYESKYFAETKRAVTEDSFGIHLISHSWKRDQYPFLKKIEKRIKHFGRVCKYYLYQRYL